MKLNIHHEISVGEFNALLLVDLRRKQKNINRIPNWLIINYCQTDYINNMNNGNIASSDRNVIEEMNSFFTDSEGTANWNLHPRDVFQITKKWCTKYTRNKNCKNIWVFLSFQWTVFPLPTNENTKQQNNKVSDENFQSILN